MNDYYNPYTIKNIQRFTVEDAYMFAKTAEEYMDGDRAEKIKALVHGLTEITIENINGIGSNAHEFFAAWAFLIVELFGNFLTSVDMTLLHQEIDRIEKGNS